MPPSKLHLLFLFFLHLQFLPLFNLHLAFPFFLQLSCVPLSDLHFPFPFFCIVSPFFSRCKHSRTCAIRQHNPSYFRRPPSRRPVSPPSTLSSLPSRSFPTELSPSYFSWFPSVHHVVASISLLSHGALPKLFLTASPPSTLSTLPSLPSPRSSPQAISHGFPSVHPLVASVSLPHGKCN